MDSKTSNVNLVRQRLISLKSGLVIAGPAGPVEQPLHSCTPLLAFHV